MEGTLLLTPILYNYTGNQTGTCLGSCGSYQFELDCWCDESCVEGGDCCADYNQTCAGMIVITLSH